MGNNSTTVIDQKETFPKLSLQCELIASNTTTIRSLDWDRSRFDIEFGLRNGTTYNSFIVEGKKKALIDSSHKKFQEIWLDILKKQIDPKTIDQIEKKKEVLERALDLLSQID